MMKRKFIQMTSGWIPVSVLLLFVLAFVTAQFGAGSSGVLLEPVAAPAAFSAGSGGDAPVSKLRR